MRDRRVEKFTLITANALLAMMHELIMRRFQKTKELILIIAIFGIMVGPAWGKSYYIDVTGCSDNADGTTTSTPWCHHPNDIMATGIAAGTALNAGDFVLYKRGEIFHQVYILAVDSGSAQTPITIGAYGSGAAPVLSASWLPSAISWTGLGGKIYSTATVTTDPAIFIYNGMYLTKNTSTPTTPLANQWGYSAGILYVSVGGTLNTDLVLVPRWEYVVRFSSADYITLQDVSVQCARSDNGYGAITGDPSQLRTMINNVSVQFYPYYAIHLRGSSNKASNHVISNNMINGGGVGRGIFVQYDTGGSGKIYGNTLSNIADVAIRVDNGVGTSVYSNTISSCLSGIVFNTTSSGNIYSNSLSTITSLSGIQLSNSDSNNIYLNTINGVWNGHYYGYGGAGKGIHIVGSSSANNVYRNTVTGSYGGIFLYPSSGTDGNKIYYNVVKNSIVNGIDMQDSRGAGPFIYNNTVYHSPAAGNSIPYVGHGIACQLNCVKATIANNIVIVDIPVMSPANTQGICLSNAYNGIKIDYNIIYVKNGTGYGYTGKLGSAQIDTFAAWKAAVQLDGKVADLTGAIGKGEEHSSGSDPLFVSDSDYHIQSISSAIDAGANAAWSGVANIMDYAGTNITDGSGNINSPGGIVDIGAYEYAPGIGSVMLIVTKSGTGTGTVTSSPSGIDCGTTCSASFTGGTVVILTASPSGGSAFTGWGGACAGTGTCVLTMDSTKSVTATFTVHSSSGSGGSGGGCFIATAAYGSYLDPHVYILRNFRDKHLLTNSLGQAFVNSYYKYSPEVADFIGKHETLKIVVRWALTPLVGCVAHPYAAAFMLSIISAVIVLARRNKKARRYH